MGARYELRIHFSNARQYILAVVQAQQKLMMIFERFRFRRWIGYVMNTTALRNNAVLARNATVAAMIKEALHSTGRDFLAGLLSVTKSSLLWQQSRRPHLRRF
jgi:hypothetical protein